MQEQNTLAQSGSAGQSSTPLVLGITSLIAWIIPIIGLPVSICGIIFSAKQNRGGCLTMCIIGFICALINSIVGAVIMSK